VQMKRPRVFSAVSSCSGESCLNALWTRLRFPRSGALCFERTPVPESGQLENFVHSRPISVSNCAQAEQVEVSRERSGRRGASGLSACTRVPSEAAQSGYSPQVYGGLALARLAGEVSSETVASSLTHGRLFRLGDLCPSAPVELTRLVNHPLAAVASCLLSWFPPCQHDSHPSSVIPS
jgi:hypothetical protein